MRKPKSILPRLAGLEGNLDEELARLALLRSQGKLLWSGGKMRGAGKNGKATIRLKIDCFRSQVKSFLPNQCWEWSGTNRRFNYGIVCIKGQHISAHRFSFAIFNHREPEQFICHRCDNPKCVNPDHLFEGTQTDNMHDCSVKGRFGDRRGEANACRKLNDDAVREIRAASISYIQLARKYGVSKSAIFMAKSGETWSHVI